MGMDVFGIEPATEQGKYFRNNVWWWNPLWTYIVSTYEELLPEDPHDGFYNNSYTVDCLSAFKLGANLLNDLESGRVDDYEIYFNAHKASLSLVDCEYCQSTGIRSDFVGIKFDLPNKELDPLIQILVGRTHGTCNVCDGIGSRPNDLISYNFTSENVREFAIFSINSGGFSIC